MNRFLMVQRCVIAESRFKSLRGLLLSPIYVINIMFLLSTHRGAIRLSEFSLSSERVETRNKVSLSRGFPQCSARVNKRRRSLQCYMWLQARQIGFKAFLVIERFNWKIRKDFNAFAAIRKDSTKWKTVEVRSSKIDEKSTRQLNNW